MGEEEKKKIIEKLRSGDIELSDDKREAIEKVSDQVFKQYKEDLKKLEG